MNDIPRTFSDWFVDTSIACGRASFAIKLDPETIELAQRWADADQPSIVDSWDTGNIKAELSAAGFPNVVSAVHVDPKTGLLTSLVFASGTKVGRSDNNGSPVIEPDSLLSPDEFVCYHYVLYWWFTGVHMMSECWNRDL